ncbi:CCA tRNA nucleotidyltransferase [Candidatus Arthromitus sp. SFB-rat-Yit]|uniref:CCA tRNA nucleotidyltransferase n=1 Tax=Candidatus Arthromitus sp. SFB-rat-Yit TaxID=1041504 RepID=UPI000227A5C0|nr:CCA tRNA nucleotidyltransferase [Candidatus Arthromitus sp. SFB-rat-Yit]BAK80574.1 polynucleotide adenylyltransferase [Candidatus Arthromitus sp. SFB-rat-Yit]
MKKFFNYKVKELINIFSKNNFKCYVVGGAIRNYLVNIKVCEVDLCTNAHPKHIKSIFKKHIDIGERFGCIKIYFKGDWFEITTLRIEKDYLDFRHANHIEFIDSPQIDSLRRDFTINSIYYDGNKLIDPNSGIHDIKNKLIRLIGDHNVRFKEDPLRMLRCIRFKSKLNFNIEFKTLLALKHDFNLITKLSNQKILEEFKKILNDSNFIKSIHLLNSLNFFSLIINENIKLFDIYSLISSLNDFHIKLFCILYFHSNIQDNLIFHVLKNNFTINKKNLNEVKKIHSYIKIFKNDKIFIKKMVQKESYKTSLNIILILSNYIDKNISKKFYKLLWGYEPLKFKHIAINTQNFVKNKKDVIKYNNYLITLLHIKPSLNKYKTLKHLINNFKP